MSLPKAKVEQSGERVKLIKLKTNGLKFRKAWLGSMENSMKKLQRLYLTIEKEDSTLPFNIGTCSYLLTQKMAADNTSLLQMSVIRLLFMSSRSCQCFDQLRSSLLTDAQCNMPRILIDKVSEPDNIMFINFIASKSLVSIITHSDTSPKCVGSVVDSLLAKLLEISHGNGVTYSLQTIVESLKSLRKSVCKVKREICVTAVTAWWPSYAHYLATSSVQQQSASSCRGTVNQELLQFISLTVECLRSIVSSQASSNVQLSAEGQVPCLPNETGLFWSAVVPQLTMLGEMIVKSSCSHSLIKFIDTVSKCSNISSEEKKMQLFDSLETLFESKVLQWSGILDSALRSWFDREGELVHSLLMIECGVLVGEEEDKESVCQCDLPPILQSASDTLLRKYLVLLLWLCLAGNSYNHSFPIQSRDCIFKLVDSLKELIVDKFTLLPESLLPILVQKAIVQIVAAQDSCLVQTLTACLKLQKLNTEVSLLNIHDLLLAFLRSIGFDHTVLLDLFISPETDFDSFLNNYFDILATAMPQLISACDKRDLVVRKYYNTNSGAQVSQKQTTTESAEESDCTAAKVPKLLDYSDSDSQEDDEGEEEDSSFSSVATLFFQLSKSLFKLTQSDSQLLPLNKTRQAHDLHTRITSILNEWTE